MKQVIVIGTSKGREKWLAQCSESCQNPKYETFVIDDNGFELAHIKRAYSMGFDEFLYLHDTCVVKSKDLFDVVFNQCKGESVALSDHPCILGMYLGKYTHDGLSKLTIPVAHNKLEAVDYEEIWTKNYTMLNPTRLVVPPLHDGFNFVTIDGRMYMKLENDFIIKYKGTWNRSMIKI